VTASLLSWVAYACGALLGALGTRDFPHHGFLLPTILAVAAMTAVALTPEQA
jgi:uncharacterized membrane protein YoaK (UPF0700 family)